MINLELSKNLIKLIKKEKYKFRDITICNSPYFLTLNTIVDKVTSATTTDTSYIEITEIEKEFIDDLIKNYQ